MNKQAQLRFPLLMCGAALFCTVLLLFLLAATNYWTCDHEASAIRQNLELEKTRGELLFYNEAAKMALRMAAAEKDLKWEQQYNIYDSKLDGIIKKWIEDAPSQPTIKTAIEVDAVNESLELLDRKCFDLLRAGKSEGAKAILESGQYQHGETRYGQLLSKLANEIRHDIEGSEREQSKAAIVSITALSGAIILMICVWSLLVRYLNKWSSTLVAECENRARAEKSLKDAKRELQHYTDELEQMVAERTAALEKAAKTAEAFGYSLAHDLRAPIHTMQGFAQALIEDYGTVFDNTGRDYAERILESARRLENLINDLLQYTHVTKQKVEMEAIDLRTAINDCLAGLRREIATRNADVGVSTESTSVLGNRALIQVIFTNLISNALKYVARGVTPKVDIWSEDGGRFVKVFVKDNGIGIEPSQQKKVFEMFKRLHRQEDYSGTGLGLAIVQQAVERMNGTVDVYFSEPGKGSCFLIQLLKANAGI